MLRWRLASAGVILAVLVLLLVGDWYAGNPQPLGLPGIGLVPVFLGAALLATGEMLQIVSAGESKAGAWPVYVGTVLVVFAPYVPMVVVADSADVASDVAIWPLFALALAVGMVLGTAMVRFRRPGGVAPHVATSIFIVAYIGLLGSFLVLLRFFSDNAWGMSALLSVFVVAKTSDAGAYLTGRLIGRHKMAPILSPGKTIEGAAGGLVFGCLASWFMFAWFIPWLVGSKEAAATVLAALAFGAIVVVAGMLGDLAISLLKRDAGQKDSSHLLPGLGGVLDVIDSVLAAAPAGYACWAIGMVG